MAHLNGTQDIATIMPDLSEFGYFGVHTFSFKKQQKTATTNICAKTTARKSVEVFA